MFVGEKYRGNRLSQKLIIKAMAYAKDLGFKKIYLVSDHENLYKKYGFANKPLILLKSRSSGLFVA